MVWGFCLFLFYLFKKRTFFSYDIDCSFPCFLFGPHHTLIISKLSTADKNSKLFFFFLNLGISAFISKNKIAGCSALAKQLLQTTLFLYCFPISLKKDLQR